MRSITFNKGERQVNAAGVAQDGISVEHNVTELRLDSCAAHASTKWNYHVDAGLCKRCHSTVSILQGSHLFTVG